MSNLKNDLPSHSDASCLFEGMTSINAIIHAIESGTNDRQILRIFFDRDKTTSKSRELAFLRKESEKLGFHIEFTNSTVIDKITTGTTHGGIVAECTKRAYPVLDATFVRQDGFYVFLDGIEDPYNFGYVLRSLYAAGVDGVVLSERNWMSAAGTVARASAGTSELLSVCIADPASVPSVFRQCGYKILAAGIRNSVSLYDADMHFPLLMIVGGEKRGINKTVSKYADKTVSIVYPRDTGISLSASSAAAIIAYQVANRLDSPPRKPNYSNRGAGRRPR